MSTRTERAFFAVAVLLALPLGAAVAQDAPPAAGGSAAVQGMQAQMLADPATRDKVLELQEDPAVKAILQDPKVMQAVRSGDLDALLSDPKLRALANHPTVRGIVQQQGR